MNRLSVLLAMLLLSLPALARPPLTNPGPDAATITGALGRPANDIYPVEVIAIDGVNLPGGRDTIWIEPGRYTLTVRGFVTNPGGLLTRLRSRNTPVQNQIEVVVEAGKRYHLGLRVDRLAAGENRRNPARVVLYRVED